MGIREVQERVSERIENVPGRYVDGTLKASRVAERGRQSAIENSVVVCVCVCVCVHAFFRACACSFVRARARACVCVCVRVCDVLSMCIQFAASPCTGQERPKLSVAFEFDPWTSFYNYMTTLGERKLARIEFANSFYLSNTF